MAKLDIGQCTDKGRVRTENEDSLVVAEPVYAVADGMGGHLAGEVASAMAVDMLRARLAGGPPADSADELVEAIRAANLAIFESAQSQSERRGMGTTVTALVVLNPATPGGPERLVLANVGDSRAYVLRRGALTQLSVDHSYVHELVATGQITKDEARFHPNRNIVTRALGIDPEVGVDAWTLPLVRGDRFVLCSDGLVDEVSDDTIAELLHGVRDPQDAAEALVATANRHGGRDNVTVVVVDVQDGMDPPDDPLELGVEPHWADGEGEVRAWRDDLRIDDTPPATRLLDARTIDRASATGSATATMTAISSATAATPGIDGALDGRARRGARFTWRTLLFLTAVIAVFVVAFAMTAVYARQGYYVGYRGTEVVVYHGKTGGLLWFDPTVAGATNKTKAQLSPEDDRVVQHNYRFDSFDGAVAFANALGSATTGTTTTAVPGGTTSTTLGAGSLVGTTVAGGTSIPAASTPASGVTTAGAGAAATAPAATAVAVTTPATAASTSPTTASGG